MAWTSAELAALEEAHGFYSKWIEDLESGNDEYLVTHRVLGVIVDDRDETLARYKRNVAELEEILKANGRS